MASANKEKKRPEMTISILGTEFEVLNDKTAGQLIIDFEIRKMGGGTIVGKAKVPLLSIWQDPLKQSVVKAHIKFDKGNPKHSDLFKALLINPNSRCKSSFGMTVNRSHIGRYGMEAKQVYSSYTSGDYVQYQIFDSKAKALDDLVERAKGDFQIGGLSLVNLSVVGENVLQEFGYEKIPDILGIGPDMWKGSPTEVMIPSSTRYDRGRYEKAKENGKGFLELLSDSLS